MVSANMLATIEKRRIVDSFEYKSIVSLEFLGEKIEVKSWRHALLWICEYLSKIDKNKIEELKYNKEFRGSFRFYFTDESIPSMNKQIPGTDTFVWVNNNANITASLIKKLVRYYGYDPYEVYAYVTER